MTDYAETHVTITHKPRSQHIVVKSPGGKTLLQVEAPPKVALRSLADYMRTWANQGEARVRELPQEGRGRERRSTGRPPGRQV